MLSKSVDITIANWGHRCRNEVYWVDIARAFVIEELFLFGHPLVIHGAHVDPSAGEKVDHNGEAGNWANVARQVLYQNRLLREMIRKHIPNLS